MPRSSGWHFKLCTMSKKKKKKKKKEKEKEKEKEKKNPENPENV